MNMKMVFSNQNQSERGMDVTDDEIEEHFANLGAQLLSGNYGIFDVKSLFDFTTSSTSFCQAEFSNSF